MLEQPNIPGQQIIECLQAGYGLRVGQVSFLPLGADFNTAVYRILTKDQTLYFLKLRRGSFEETAVTLPKFLYDQGIQQIIPPLPTKLGQLWGQLADYKTILYPLIDGRDGYEVTLSENHWAEFGNTLKKIHTANVPDNITNRLRQETYAPEARQFMRQFLGQRKTEDFANPIAKQMAEFIHSKQAEILDLVERAERLAQILQTEPPDFIVCHSDLHAGNLFIGTDGAFFIVDWDELILAAKERDLMYIGSGLLASGLTPDEEAIRFYQSYGQTTLNPFALAYYRYERIIQDLFEYGKRLLITDAGEEDLEQSLYYLQSNFLPNHTIDIAYQSDNTQQ